MITAQTGTIKEVVQLSQQIPEFHQPYGIEEYETRLKDLVHLILIGYYQNKPVGFKVGYEQDGSFYSWMGGVLPAYRRKGIARYLAETQEKWAKSRGYTTITLKTRNHHKGMLIFALNSGFNIVGFESKATISDHRILLRKEL